LFEYQNTGKFSKPMACLCVLNSVSMDGEETVLVHSMQLSGSDATFYSRLLASTIAAASCRV
jgi:hypothetical protein